MVKKRRRRKKIFLPKIQTLFCLVSLVFILGCFIYYGNRLIKYYKIYNPKTETGEVLLNLSSKIIESEKIEEENDGLYEINGNYVYKGKNVNNYLLLDQLLFRIIRINVDKSIDLVLDEYINRIPWNETITTYDKSNIKSYIESKILPILDQEKLVKTSYCTDKIHELSEISCNETNNDNYIRLLGINDYLNSLNNDKTYMNSGNEYIWLYNSGEKNVWHTTGSYLANSSPNNSYGIKVVVTLKNSTVYLNGDGSLENPYIVELGNKDIKVGTYLDIDDNIYTVYEVGEDYYKVESNKVLQNKELFDKSSSDYTNSSLKKYLENTYLEKLSFKKLLKEVKFDGYISSIGILNSNDLKFNSSLNNYYLSDKENNLVQVYNGSILKSDPNTKRNIRISLGIKKDLEIISGNGSKYAPFIIKVED